MMTTNKLTKTFASGSLAIGVLAGAVLTATSASATTPSPDGSSGSVKWADWVAGNPLVIHNGNGATATYVGGTFDPLEDNDDTVTFFKTGDEYEFTYSAIPGTFATDSGSGTIIYDITFPTFVNGVAIDSDVTANYGTVTKEIDGLTPPFPPLVSDNGSEDPLVGFQTISPKLSLTVKDTISNPNGPGEGLSTLSNNFREAPHVPEPGTILGLLAVGGLGLVSRFKKQK
ncbi:MAG: PEP-CTERM sorting domain-containing protein [Microcystis sp. LE17-20A]|jgi:hypothetical protein|uniref:PEP-CTERM sorting domain-containing protein n=1 Tax=unclassified Microcystis TaxID=2643300 RepID=UPI0022C163B9|nr:MULTISPECIES: PEP-CTERM sorting domain-containing protein [unclassified Microcystis]MCZ8037195.1 PEP-CTERM sorting domain-containing protein [Microcystis sp. LE17-20A]MCZ8210624.1 PEP-CTERM sorting domain-containing protein [Microcystis sp. LE19-8.1F]